MPKESDREREHYYRARWLFSLLYLCGLRISEVVGNTMGSFFCRRDKDGDECWWLEILGKGDKLRIVPATNELMVELGRYRREKGLASFPLAGDDVPLLLPIGRPVPDVLPMPSCTANTDLSEFISSRNRLFSSCI
jgi:integrase